MKKTRRLKKNDSIHSRKERRFKNPYFRQKKQSIFRTLLPFIFILLAICAGLSYSIYGPVLHIKDVNVSGLTTIPQENVETFVWQELNNQGFGVFPKNHQWFIPETSLRQKLMNEFDLSKADISLNGSTLSIQAEERILEFVWRVDRSFYFVDLEGVITRKLRQNERNSLLNRLNMELDPLQEDEQRSFAVLQPKMPIIEDKTQTEVKVGDRVLPAGVSDNILTFDLGLRQLSLAPLIYESESRIDPWFRVVINQSYKILFDGAGNPSDQLNALSVVLQEYKGKSIEKYIDVRFENRAFVK